MLVFGFQGFDHAPLNVVALYAAETAMSSGSSPMKSDSHPRSRIEGIAPIAATGSILKPERESDRSKIERKPRKLIRKPSTDQPPSEFPQEADQGRPATTPLAGDPATLATKDSVGGVAKPVAGISPVSPPISPGSSMSTISPGVPASSAIAGVAASSPGSSLGAMGSDGSSSGGGRSIQNLMRQLPGLQQLLTARPSTPRPPPEAIAEPAPPLGPPQAGLPPPPPNWPAYHVLNRLSYGGTPNQLNTVSHLTPQEAAVWAVEYMKEQLELDP